MTEDDHLGTLREEIIRMLADALGSQQLHAAEMSRRDELHVAETGRRDELHLQELLRRDGVHAHELLMIREALSKPAT